MAKKQECMIIGAAPIEDVACSGNFLRKIIM